jgi:hypothetical protein
MPERYQRPIFARVYTKFAKTSNRRGGAEHRRKLLADLNGRVIELGAGSGANFAHYIASVDEVLAVEPEPYLRQQALRRRDRLASPRRWLSPGARHGHRNRAGRVRHRGV